MLSREKLHAPRQTFCSECGRGPGGRPVLRAPGGGVTVGRFDETCTVTRTSPMDTSDLQCQITLSLSEGQITVQGVFAITGAGPGDITLAITGGTGRFRTAHGFIHAVNSSNTETQLTVHLIR
ncbi:allene oxide cyclase barrel-like domain-containing protein [Stenotrophomonas sp. NPDC087984]